MARLRLAAAMLVLVLVSCHRETSVDVVTAELYSASRTEVARAEGILRAAGIKSSHVASIEKTGVLTIYVDLRDEARARAMLLADPELAPNVWHGR